MGPSSVDHDCKNQIGSKIPQFCLGGDGWEAEFWEVGKDGSSDERDEEVGPHWEGLLGEVSEDDLCGHAAEDEGEDDTEEDEVVVAEDVGGWRSEPGNAGEGEGQDRGPFKENWKDWKAIAAAGFDDVDDAKWPVGKEEGTADDWNPKINGGIILEEPFISESISERLRPDLRTVVTGGDDETAGNDQTLGWAVEVTQVENVGVVSLPGAEPHGQDRNESSEDTLPAASQTDSSNLQDTSQGAVQRIDSMVEQFSQGR